MKKAELADLAMTFIGYPAIRYRNPVDGQSPEGFDCSGFPRYLLGCLQFPGIEKVRHCNEFMDCFGVFIHSECVGKGDLVFFSWDGCVPRHMGIMLSPDEYMHSPGIDGQSISISLLRHSSIDSSSNTQIYFRNPIAFKRLAIRRGRYLDILD